MTEPARRPITMRMRYGVHRPLEDAADALIYGQVREIKRHSENDILTPWKEKDRRKHEIYVPSGTPDASNRLGIYHRAINPGRPEMNSREGVARGLQSRGIAPNINDTSLDWSSTPHSRYSSDAGTDSLRSFVFGEGEDRD